MMKASLKIAEAAVLMGILVGLGLALGCSPPGGGSNDGSSVVEPTPTPTPTPTPDPATLSPLTLEVSTAWDGTPAPVFHTHKVCEVEPNAVRGSTTTCSLSIEEARLFYSSTKFTWATNRPDRCRAISFFPYVYQRASDNVYIPPGETAAPPCDAPFHERSPKCFGGAAVYLVDGFPANTGIVGFTFGTTSFSKSMESEFKLRHYFGERVNYLLTNDLIDRTTPIGTEPKQFEGLGFWRDYEVICEDEWGFPWHKLVVTISDENYDGSDGHPEDEYDDWN
ncbi:MAG: hypothetical protein KF767_14475 [Bdellovibrionaceae bacterium]|nr:hypothetical protein [Pseudobdellovibrionaceae bacterium]